MGKAEVTGVVQSTSGCSRWFTQFQTSRARRIRRCGRFWACKPPVCYTLGSENGSWYLLRPLVFTSQLYSMVICHSRRGTYHRDTRLHIRDKPVYVASCEMRSMFVVSLVVITCCARRRKAWKVLSLFVCAHAP